MPSGIAKILYLSFFRAKGAVASFTARLRPRERPAEISGRSLYYDKTHNVHRAIRKPCRLLGVQGICPLSE